MSEWYIQCTRFSHDRLQNQFLQSVMRLVRVLEGRTVDEGFVSDFVDRLAFTWGELEREALELVGRAESEVGPSAWFRTYPLSRLCDEDRVWMAELMTGEAQLTIDTRVILKDISDTLHEVSSHCRNLVLAFRNSPPNGSLGLTTTEHTNHNSGNNELLECAIELYQSCRRLCHAFRALTLGDAIKVIASFDKMRHA